MKSTSQAQPKPEEKQVKKARQVSKKPPGPYKEDQLKANVILKVYMTTGESETFTQAFKHYKAGRKISKSEYAKEQIFRASNPIASSSKKEGTSGQPDQLPVMQYHLNKLDHLGRQLSQINNNLNQSTKRLHQFKLWSQLGDEFKSQEPLIDDLKALTQQVKQLYTQLETTYGHLAD